MTSNYNNDWLTNPIISLGAKYNDERGNICTILSLLDPTIGSVVLIDSKKGSIRANHYHKTDWHYCYVVSGKIDYYTREVNSKETPFKTTILKNQLFYTPPMLEHAMYFPEDTVFFTFGGGSRKQEEYEADLVRVTII